ncbi:MAG: hypothetical protein JSV62_16365 [Promethearchaeota archaeon]|nr:MAG: hypothetical protein JSV62_16365 [Candidatus Lokiarchaeota archaeon]
MKENIDLNLEDLLKLMRYSFLRLDGAWFMASAEKLGLETATELDVKAWEMFSERLGKKIASLTNLKDGFSQTLPKLMKIHHMLMNMNSEIEVINESKMVHRVLDCEVWRMAQKVWPQDAIPCHKVTLASIRGLLKGAFPEKEFILKHNKKIPLGDPCCEIEISVNNS